MFDLLRNTSIGRVLLMTLTFVVFYLDISGGALGIATPSVFSFFIPILLGGIVYSAVWASPIIIAFMAAMAISFAFSPAHPLGIKVFSSVAQTCWSVFLFFLVLRWLMLQPPRILKAFALWAYISIFIIITLERLGILSGLSMAFGEIAYPGDTGFSFYSGEFSLDRDVYIAGFRRPTAFSPEPSIVAIAISTLSICLISSIKRIKMAVLLIISLLAAWRLIGSPIPFLTAGFLLPYFVRNLKLPAKGAILIALGLVGFVFMSIAIEGRLDSLLDIESAYESSEGIRLVLPFMNLIGAWREGAVMGVGPGAIMDFDFISRLNPYRVSQFGTNAIALFLFYFGPILSIALVFFFVRNISRVVSWRDFSILTLIAIVVLGLSLGTFESPRLLVFLAFVMAFDRLRVMSVRAHVA